MFHTSSCKRYQQPGKSPSTLSNHWSVAEGFIVYPSIHGVCVILITSVKHEHESLPCPLIQTNRQHQPKTIGACINVHVAWEIQYISLCTPADTSSIIPDQSVSATCTEQTTTKEPAAYAPPSIKATTKPRLKKRKQPEHVDVSDSTSQSSSYDLELERAKSRSRREAQPLRPT